MQPECDPREKLADTQLLKEHTYIYLRTPIWIPLLENAIDREVLDTFLRGVAAFLGCLLRVEATVVTFPVVS